MTDAPTERHYCKFVQHCESSLHWTTYYLDETTVGRIDFIDPKRGLFKISYREVEPPSDAALAQHRERYPGVMAEFVMPAVAAGEGLRVLRSQLFIDGVLKRRFEAYLDANGREVSLVHLTPEGTRQREERFIYDAAGERVGARVYDGSGRFKYEENYLDPW